MNTSRQTGESKRHGHRSRLARVSNHQHGGRALASGRSLFGKTPGDEPQPYSMEDIEENLRLVRCTV